MTTDLITTITQDGGFTFDATTGTLVTVGTRTGYAVAVPGTEHVVGDATITREAFADAVADVATQYADRIARGAVIGGWYSEDRGVYVVELTDILTWDRRTAELIGRIRNQEAIFDLATGEVIPTGGTGDVT